MQFNIQYIHIYLQKIHITCIEDESVSLAYSQYTLCVYIGALKTPLVNNQSAQLTSYAH